MIEHEWDSAGEACIHCGTKKAFHEGRPQNCVPRWTEPPPRPTSTGRNVGDFAAARLIELEADRLAIRNTPGEQ